MPFPNLTEAEKTLFKDKAIALAIEDGYRPDPDDVSFYASGVYLRWDADHPYDVRDCTISWDALNKPVVKKQIIRVFPDYMSSGFWDAGPGVNLDPSVFDGILPDSILIAVKYWHSTWESFSSTADEGTISEYVNQWESFSSTADEGTISEYVNQWNKDGARLVELMNECQDKYQFVYEKYE
jgi:hypothetical protein